MIAIGRARSSHGSRALGAAWSSYLAAGTAVTFAYFTVPSPRLKDLVFGLVGASAVVALAVGIRTNRPHRPLPWILFAAGQLLFVAGDATMNVAADVVHRPLQFPSVADGLYLLAYPTLAAGFLMLVRWRSPGRDTEALLDAGIIVSGIGLLSWVFLMSHVAHNPGLSTAARIVSLAYPLFDLLLVGVAVRLSVGAGIRSPSYRLLLASLVALLVADTLYVVPAISNSYTTGNPIDAGWLLSYVLWGAAALHPSAATLADPVPVKAERLTNTRLAGLAIAIVLGPTVLLTEGVHDQRLDATVVAGGCVVLFLLVLVRMAGLIRAVERKVSELRAQGMLLKREQDALAELRELSRMKTEFVATASHELRTPLTSLIGYTKTLQQPQFQDDAETRREFLRAMERQGSRLLLLVENLLATSAVERDAFHPTLRVVPVDVLVRDLLEAMQDRASRIRATVPGGVEIVTDRELFVRALCNLVDNALKYSPSDSTCRVWVEVDDGTVRFSVRDHGIGISTADQARIFDRFYQVDSSPTRSVNGVGLGLALAREIVENLGGTIDVESELGFGSTFAISLPAMRTEASTIPAAAGRD